MNLIKDIISNHFCNRSASDSSDNFNYPSIPGDLCAAILGQNKILEIYIWFPKTSAYFKWSYETLKHYLSYLCDLLLFTLSVYVNFEEPVSTNIWLFWNNLPKMKFFVENQKV